MSELYNRIDKLCKDRGINPVTSTFVKLHYYVKSRNSAFFYYLFCKIYFM